MSTPLAADFQALLGYVIGGIGCPIVPYSYKDLCPPSISILPVSGIDIVYNIEIVHRTRNNDPTVHRFINAFLDQENMHREVQGPGEHMAEEE